jgi:CubicO group peptidase (beta-lactamase class C family)
MREAATLLLVTVAVVSGALHAQAGHAKHLRDPAENFLLNNFTGCAAARIGPSPGSPGGTLYQQAFGSLDFRGFVPMPTAAHFPVASNTKVYVAISLYQLQERGIVKLDDAIQKYLTHDDFNAFGVPNMTSYCPVVAGDATNTCQNITFVQLLSMQACIPDTDFQFLPYPGNLALVFGRYINLPLACKPGTAYYYSNPAFMLGAYFVEKFTGMTWRAYLEENVHGPLGQKNTYFDPFNGQFRNDPLRVDEWYEMYDAADTSVLLSKSQCRNEFDTGSASGAGGIISSQDDEALLYFTLFNFAKSFNGAPLFASRDTVIDLVRPRTPIGPVQFNSSQTLYYAQGLFVSTDNASNPIPPGIQYEGEIICSHTANIFMVAELASDGETVVKPAIMGQAWSAVRVAYPTNQSWVSAQSSGSVSFGWQFAQWRQRLDLVMLAFDLLSLFR